MILFLLSALIISIDLGHSFFHVHQIFVVIQKSVNKHNFVSNTVISVHKYFKSS